MDVGGASILHGFCMQLQKDLWGGERFSDLKSVKPLKSDFLVLFTRTLILFHRVMYYVFWFRILEVFAILLAVPKISTERNGRCLCLQI